MKTKSKKHPPTNTFPAWHEAIAHPEDTEKIGLGLCLFSHGSEAMRFLAEYVGEGASEEEYDALFHWVFSDPEGGKFCKLILRLTEEEANLLADDLAPASHGALETIRATLAHPKGIVLAGRRSTNIFRVAPYEVNRDASEGEFCVDLRESAKDTMKHGEEVPQETLWSYGVGAILLEGNVVACVRGEDHPTSA